MNCEQAAEFVSALFDGERIPRPAAEHIRGCGVCATRMQEYAVIAAELRIVSSASYQIERTTSASKAKSSLNLWQKGLQTMRIPRFAFAIMLILIISLAAGIAIVRANGSQQWFQFQVRTRDGRTAELGVVNANPSGNIPDPGPSVSVVDPDGILIFILRVLDAKGGVEKLGLRALWLPPTVPRSEATKQVQKVKETEVWLTPGQELKFPVKEYGELSIRGQLLDKLPDANNPEEQKLYPQEGRFRLMSPQFLLRDGNLLSTGGGDGSNVKKGSFFAYFVPRDGWYVIAFQDFPGSHEGVIHENLVEFDLGGKSYKLIAAAPITDADKTKIWARHIPGAKLADDGPRADEDSPPMTAFGDIAALSKHLPNK